MAKLKYDPKNYRIHTDKNKRLIHKSLVDCGAGRSILIDKEDCIIAGNGVYEQSQKLGLKVKIIESDGSEIIAIKRTDLATEDDRRKALALADNHTTDTSVFDIEAVIEDFSPEMLDAWEFTFGDIDLEGFENPELVPATEDMYTKKIKSPIYKPSGEKPPIGELYDLTKYNELVTEIEQANISERDKIFLKFAASRHIVFDYGKIAEYYAHSNSNVQDLMEASALVIIDFNKAIEMGYVRLKEEIANQYMEDYDNDEA